MAWPPDPGRTIAFLTFAAVVAGTPGPSNTLLIAVGARLGVRRGAASLLGQVAGMAAMLFAVTLGLGGLLLAAPLVLQVLKWGGAALLCWMAWRIATAEHADAMGSARAGFLRMAAFQWINPKGWLVAVAAVATFLDPHAGSAPVQAAYLSLVFALIALPSCFPWLAFGAALTRALKTPRARRAVNIALAALLVASVAMLLWPGAL